MTGFGTKKKDSPIIGRVLKNHIFLLSMYS
nr:MAG TPA: hypothetical protein [Caudoviricetes sp.]